MTMHIDQIRRDALGLWLRGMRLPLTVAERIARPADAKSWPPAVAFARVEASVTGVVGRLTGDQTLIARANLEGAEADQRDQALAKTAEAEAARVEARKKAEAREATLARQRELAEERASEKERQVEQDKREAEQQVAQEKARKQAATRKQAASRKKAIETQAAKAEADRLRKEAQTLRAKQKAVDAEGTVLDLDKAVRTKKAKRKAS
jgi:hypothetical protein